MPWQGTGLNTFHNNDSSSSLTSFESDHPGSDTAFSAAGDDMSATDEEPTGQYTTPARTYGAEHFAGLAQSLFDLDDGDEDDEEYQAQEEDFEGDEDAEGDDDTDMYM